MKKTLFALIIGGLAAAATAADTYGYLIFWQNPANLNESVQVKTTRENAPQADAHQEMRDYCRSKDIQAGVQQDNEHTGCKTIVPLHNTCVAVAFPKNDGRLMHDTAVVMTSPFYRNAQQAALNQCMKKYGTQGKCVVETAYCTESAYYGGTVRTMWNRLKSR